MRLTVSVCNGSPVRPVLKQPVAVAVLCLVGAIALGPAGLAGCAPEGDRTPKDARSEEAPRAGVVLLTPEAAARSGIEARPVGRGEFRTFRDFPGTVQPNENELAEITTLVRGRVVAVFADFGKDVKAGELLANLYSTDLGAAQSAHLVATAKLQVAALAYERARDLLEGKAVSRAEFERRQGDMISARSEARETRHRLELMGMRDADIARLEREQTIRAVVPIAAPFDGRIIIRNVTRGEVVESTHKLFTVADLSDVWVMASVPEKDLRFIHRNQTVEVRTSAYPDEVFPGTITYLGDILDPATRAMRVRVTAPNRDGRLKPEMFATVRVYGQPEPDVLAVPTSAIQGDAGQPMVFVQLDSRRFEPRTVRLGEESGDLVKVIAGLREGERVVTKGAFALRSEVEKHKIEPVR